MGNDPDGGEALCETVEWDRDGGTGAFVESCFNGAFRIFRGTPGTAWS